MLAKNLLAALLATATVSIASPLPQTPPAAENETTTQANKCATICPALYSPVCVVSGYTVTTYENPCRLSITECSQPTKRFNVLHDGECMVEDMVAACERMCTMDWQPLCTTTGVTFANRCAFETAQCKQIALRQPPLKVARQGEC
ncbi:hypothetical protein HDV05_007801 [Chytridiales sp. JEL 0842]|nr:hypothetical protein HDV05_007801 [Chytridiales sp. JEL 0842]